MANKRIDEPTGTETVGHEWDGIEELDTPMPRWWLWTFYITIAWAAVYVVLYPAWPLISHGTQGVLGWTSRGQLAKEMSAADAARQSLREQIAAIDVEKLAASPDLMSQAVAGGAAAFKVNCVQCHGSGAAGSAGYPNLNDDDWLWGGSLPAIHQTILHGIRQPGDDQTRTSQMPAFGDILEPRQISDVAGYVMSLSGKGPANAAGAQIFADNCAVCHGADGKGLRQFGAPNLADAIWLYGGTKQDVMRQVRAPRHGVMPAWQGRLDPVTIKMLAAYVHSLGGGEDFTQVTETPVEQSNEQP
ncbi:cytochrome-c oxidase, cbb3-type subunit III [Croceibacterium aestuarii]|uniref:cytochrome-c oxidase, cbb3-type subunit III n=1 Tax=Croceibacterium aestuarii TaxID=3064139 RepID=UPI00272E3668|nr:cytochrome-c oxidase, cbb3-type subunit III [Croceibacterium sp. D39]